MLYGQKIDNLRDFLSRTICYELGSCSTFSGFGSAFSLECFRARHSLLIENLALRQQLAMLKRRRCGSPKLDRLVGERKPRR
jgi:hypothetical protein